MSEWFEHWFGDVYLELYPHRDDAEAAQLVALLSARGIIGKGGNVLDLACGAGRHSAALSKAGENVTGLDLSMPLLQSARRRGVDAALVRGDMRRLPLRDEAINTVVNLFTSFGYFASDDEHQAALDEIRRVLRRGGRFVIDFLNAPNVRANLVPRDEKVIGGRRVVQERRLENNGKTVTKGIHLVDEGRSFLERVRLFERADLELMLGASGLRVDEVYGDYAGGAWSEQSPRVLILATRR